jgi:hypothetical protein
MVRAAAEAPGPPAPPAPPAPPIVERAFKRDDWAGFDEPIRVMLLSEFRDDDIRRDVFLTPAAAQPGLAVPSRPALHKHPVAMRQKLHKRKWSREEDDLLWSFREGYFNGSNILKRERPRFCLRSVEELGSRLEVLAAGWRAGPDEA